MKKALLLVVGIVAVAFLVGNADYINNFLETLQTGALIPLVVATILMVLRHVTQAQSYVAAFEAVDHKSTLRHMIILIFSLVFINTFCLFSGATGVVFIVDDARREGADSGTATSGAFLSQIGYFAAVFVITVIGFVTMLLTSSINTVFLVGGLMLAGVLAALSSLFVIGHFKPAWLRKFFGVLQKVLAKILGVFKKKLGDDWGEKQAGSFIDNANMLAKNPMGTFFTVAWASLSALLNMACLVAIGYAFGFTEIAPLIAAFALAAVSVIVSPTPQGVGVVEAAIIMILTASGCALTTATAIALVYRGIMFWVPFCFGAVMLTQSGFFKGDKNASDEKKANDTAWLTGVIVAIYGIVNIVIALASSLLQPYMMMAQIADLSQIFPGLWLALAGVFFVVLASGLVLRFQSAWAVTFTSMLLVAGGQFLYVGTLLPAVFAAGFAVWLFVKRHAFDKPFSMESVRARFSKKAEPTEEDKRVVEGVVSNAAGYARDEIMRRNGFSDDEIRAYEAEMRERSRTDAAVAAAAGDGGDVEAEAGGSRAKAPQVPTPTGGTPQVPVPMGDTPQVTTPTVEESRVTTPTVEEPQVIPEAVGAPVGGSPFAPSQEQRNG